jgi:YVTN family beta-propeller protein
MRSRMSGFVLTGVALGVAMFTPRSWGQVAEHPVLLALSKTDHTLSIVDPVTLKVIAKMPVGPDPHEVIASADGTRVGFQYAEQPGTRVGCAGLGEPQGVAEHRYSPHGRLAWSGLPGR